MDRTSPDRPDHNAVAEALAADVAAGHAAKAALKSGLPASAAWHTLPPALVLIDAETRRVAARYPIRYDVVESPLWSGDTGRIAGGLVVPEGEVATIEWRAMRKNKPAVEIESGTIRLGSTAARVSLVAVSGGGADPEPIVAVRAVAA